MGDKNWNLLISQLFHFSRQSLRREMAACGGDFPQAIWKGRLKDNRPEIGASPSPCPNLLRRSRISEMEQGLGFLFNKKSESGDDVMNAHPRDKMVSHPCRAIRT